MVIRSDGLGTLKVYIGSDLTGLERGIKRAEKRITDASKRMGELGSKLSQSLTLPLTMIGGFGVSQFGKFDRAMTRSLAIMGDVDNGMRKRMKNEARRLSRDSVTNADELARSYFYLASAGMTAEQSLANLGVVNKFAIAGAFDMAQATDLLTDAQSALGLTVEDTMVNQANMIKLSDVLVKANTLANATVEQFSTSLTRKAGPAIRLLNKDMEEGVAVLAAFADQGIKGELAGNALHIVFRDLQRAVTKNAEVWERKGLSVYDEATGKMKNIADIVEQLENHFGSLSDRQKKVTADMLGFQDRSFAFMQTLFGTSEAIREYEKQLRNAGGVTDRVANKNMSDFLSVLKITYNNIKDAARIIGGVLAPSILGVGEFVRDTMKRFIQLDASLQRQIVFWGALAAAIGPVLLLLSKLMVVLKVMALNPFVIAITAVAFAIARISGTLKTLNPQMGDHAGKVDSAMSSYDSLNSVLGGVVKTMSLMNKTIGATERHFEKVGASVEMIAANRNYKKLRRERERLQKMREKYYKILSRPGVDEETARRVSAPVGHDYEMPRALSDKYMKGLDIRIKAALNRGRRASENLDRLRGEGGNKQISAMDIWPQGLQNLFNKVDWSKVSTKMQRWEKRAAFSKRIQDMQQGISGAWAESGMGAAVSDFESRWGMTREQMKRNASDLESSAAGSAGGLPGMFGLGNKTKPYQLTRPSRFRQIAQNRFSIEGLAMGSKKKQAQPVVAKGLEKKLETLIQVTRENRPIVTV
jgi:TP901 family phage tail tape measure protein